MSRGLLAAQKLQGRAQCSWLRRGLTRIAPPRLTAPAASGERIATERGVPLVQMVGSPRGPPEDRFAAAALFVGNRGFPQARSKAYETVSKSKVSAVTDGWF